MGSSWWILPTQAIRVCTQGLITIFPVEAASAFPDDQTILFDALDRQPFLNAVDRMYIRAYTELVGYEWDPEKAVANFSKHGVLFSDAVSVLQDELALTVRDPYSEEEERWITLGLDLLGRLLVVVYVWRGETIRFISARPATPRERQEYQGVGSIWRPPE